MNLLYLRHAKLARCVRGGKLNSIRVKLISLTNPNLFFTIFTFIILEINLVLSFDAIARDKYNQPKDCGNLSCSRNDWTGMQGLLPKRTYKIAYSADDAVCEIIDNSLNNTIALGMKSAENLMPQVNFAGTNVYQFSDDLLFANPIFVRWHYLGKPAENHTGPLLGRIMDNNYRTEGMERWTAIQLGKDRTNFIITRGGYASNQTQMWQIQNSDTQIKDWSNPETYNNYTPFSIPDTLHPGVKTDLVWAYKMGLGKIGLNGKPLSFPGLSVELQSQYPWNIGRSAGNGVEFAYINSKYYGVYVGTLVDIIYVVDYERFIGDDLCYISSLQ